MHINSINAVNAAASNQLKRNYAYQEKPIDQPIGQDTVSFQHKMASTKTRNALFALLALLGGSAALTGCQKDEPDAVVVTTEISKYPGGYITDDYTADVTALKNSPNQSIGDSIKLGESYYDENGVQRHQYEKLVIKGYVPADMARGGRLSSADLARLGIPSNASYRILKDGDRVMKPQVNNYNFDVNQEVELNIQLDSINAALQQILAEMRNGNMSLARIEAAMLLANNYLSTINTNVENLPQHIRETYEMIRGLYEDWINNHWEPYTDEQVAFRLNLMNLITHYGNTNDMANAGITHLLYQIYNYLPQINAALSAGFNDLMENDNINTAAIIAAINNVTTHIDLADANRTNEAGSLMTSIAGLRSELSVIKLTALQILARMNDFNPQLLAKLNAIIANQNTQIANQNAMDAHQQQGFADVIAAINNIVVPGSSDYDAKLDRIIELLFQGNGIMTSYGEALLGRFDDLIPLVRNGFISMNTHFTLTENNQAAMLGKMDDLSGLVAAMDAHQQAAAAEMIWREDTIIAKLDAGNLVRGDIRNLVQNLNINPQIDLTALELLVGQISSKMDTANARLADLHVDANDIKAILNAMKARMIADGEQAHADALAILNRIPDPCNCSDCCDQILEVLWLIAQGRYDEAEHSGGSIFG